MLIGYDPTSPPTTATNTKLQVKGNVVVTEEDTDNTKVLTASSTNSTFAGTVATLSTVRTANAAFSLLKGVVGNMRVKTSSSRLAATERRRCRWRVLSSSLEPSFKVSRVERGANAALM